MSYQNEVQQVEAAMQQSQPEESIKYASKLWRTHGNGVPFGEWVNNEVVKAKQAGIWKQGMSFKDIFDANRPSDTDTEKESSVSKDVASGKNQFLIAGKNGYKVLAVTALVIAGIVYLVKQSKNK